MVGFMQPPEEKKPLEDIPQDLSLLPLRNTVAFPFMILPLSVGVPRSIKLVEDTMHGNRLVGLVASKDPELDEPVPGQTYTVAPWHGYCGWFADPTRICRWWLKI